MDNWDKYYNLDKSVLKVVFFRIHAFLRLVGAIILRNFAI